MAEPRLRRKIQDSRIQRQRGLFPTTSGAGLAERFDPAQRMTNMLGDAMGVQAEETGVLGGVPSSILRQRVETEPGTGRVATLRMPKLVEPEELNRRHAGLGLKFERPMTEEGAQRLADLARARRIRDSVIRREPEGLGQLGLGLGASLLNMALDPLEVASVFVPVVSQARQAAWIARSGAIAGRARVGLVEGAAGNLMMEPAYMSLSKSLQMDYGMGDAIANVFLGSVLGGALGGGLGAARQFRRPLVLRPDQRIDEPISDFSSSAVQDTVYHGTLAQFDRFSAVALRAEERERDARLGFFFSTSKEVAETYARGHNFYTDTSIGRALNKITRGNYERLNEWLVNSFGASARGEGRVINARVDVRNPRIVDLKGKEYDEDLFEAEIMAAKQDGNDGVIFRATKDSGDPDLVPETPADTVVVFSDRQIRTFDPNEAAQRGQALKGAIAQMAQGKSVRVADTAEEVSRLKNKERLARGRVTQIRNELERARAEGDADRVRDLEGRLARAEAQHQLARAEVEGGRATVAQRVAADEQRIERSSTYDADAARRLDEAQKQDPLPEDDAVQQEVDSFLAEFEQAVERGEITEENLEAIRNELKTIDDELAAGERTTEFLKTCLKR